VEPAVPVAAVAQVAVFGVWVVADLCVIEGGQDTNACVGVEVVGGGTDLLYGSRVGDGRRFLGGALLFLEGAQVVPGWLLALEAVSVCFGSGALLRRPVGVRQAGVWVDAVAVRAGVRFGRVGHQRVSCPEGGGEGALRAAIRLEGEGLVDEAVVYRRRVPAARRMSWMAARIRSGSCMASRPAWR
jgi:hypothetical protein